MLNYRKVSLCIYLKITIHLNEVFYLFQVTIKESTEKLERSQTKIAELARNLTTQIIAHTHLLEKVIINTLRTFFQYAC